MPNSTTAIDRATYNEDFGACPLVSIFHMTYNQPEGLREALEASFTQDYPNLEIVISDDHSTDETFDVVEKAVADYDGPHIVRVTRNGKNLGVVGNFNTAMTKTSGGLIVQVNGDDISRPDRVRRLVEVWNDDPQAKLVYSPARWIFADGRLAGMLNVRPESDYDQPATEFILNRLYVTGASAAYDRSIFDAFGPISSKAGNEDHIMPFRARVLGRIRKVDDVLIDVRPGGVSWSGETEEEKKRTKVSIRAKRVGIRRAYLQDMKGRRLDGKLRATFYCHLFLVADAIAKVPVGGQLWNALNVADRWVRKALLR